MKNRKPFALFARLIFFFICLGFTGFLNAAIKNGYEKDIIDYELTLKNYRELLSNADLSAEQKRIIKSHIESLVRNISYYKITELLLVQFQNVAPNLFDEVGSIMDAKGRPVNVYVKIIQKYGTAVNTCGLTYLNHLNNDSDAYVSEYGIHTVSVKIWAVNEALFVLAHEFGHVLYQVPHIASYINDYKKYYQTTCVNFHSLGHHPRDLSGKSAHQYVKRFRKEYFYFLKTDNQKIQSPAALLARIRKNLRAANINAPT